MDHSHRRVAYFSMEIGLKAEIPTYAGGLGVLAGDTIRSAADLGLPLVAVTLVHRAGYFDQHFDAGGWQTERPVVWRLEDHLAEQSARTSVRIEGRDVRLRAWRFDVRGVTGFTVPVYLLDSDLPENSEQDRELTHHLYGGDQRYRLCQEAILGIGGVRILRELGHHGIERFHLNEGHASLLTYELLAQRVAAHQGQPTSEDIESVRRRCVFTTHTPVPAGHDKFSMDLVHSVLGHSDLLHFQDLFCCDGVLNMTRVALKLSRYVNGVAKRHADVSRQMFLPYSIDSITNGVHAPTWVSRPMQILFDRHIPGWREDNFSLRYTMGIPEQEVWDAHQQAKGELLALVNRVAGSDMSTDVFTLAYARRATAYKRPDMLISDLPRLRDIARTAAGGGDGTGLQVIYAGKAHPRDTQGKELIRRIHQTAAELRPHVKLVYLANYDMHTAGLITAGADLWLNTPEPPLEASGTSGMKAALNGVPSLSTLDGWWLEGCIEGVTGWAIGVDTHATLEGIKLVQPAHHPSAGGRNGNGNGGRPPMPEASPAETAAAAALLYEKLQDVILPMFLHDRSHFIDVMRSAIAFNGSFFNTERMVHEYVLKAYFT